MNLGTECSMPLDPTPSEGTHSTVVSLFLMLAPSSMAYARTIAVSIRYIYLEFGRCPSREKYIFCRWLATTVYLGILCMQHAVLS